MTKLLAKTPRRQQILECFAKMLEASPGERITTAILAKEVGVSEAALYRHFPSKSKMFEGLIEFVETTIFTQIATVLDEEKLALPRCEKIISSVLIFSERNPGLTRLLTGDALTGETERLRLRVAHIFERIEIQFNQILLGADVDENTDPKLHISAAANVLTALVIGRLATFVGSEFRQSPTEYWNDQWSIVVRGFLRPKI